MIGGFDTFVKVLCPCCGKHLFSKSEKGVLVYCKRCKKQHFIPLEKIKQKSK